MEDINSELDRGSDRLDQATPEELLEFAHHYEQSYILCQMIQNALADRLKGLTGDELESYRPLWDEVARIVEAAKAANTSISD